MGKIKTSLGVKYAEVKHVWRAAEHLVASVSLLVVSLYAGTDAYANRGLQPDHRIAVVGAAIVIGLIGGREVYNYLKNVKLDK